MHQVTTFTTNDVGTMDLFETSQDVPLAMQTLNRFRVCSLMDPSHVLHMTLGTTYRCMTIAPNRNHHVEFTAQHPVAAAAKDASQVQV